MLQLDATDPLLFPIFFFCVRFAGFLAANPRLLPSEPREVEDLVRTSAIWVALRWIYPYLGLPFLVELLALNPRIPHYCFLGDFTCMKMDGDALVSFCYTNFRSARGLTHRFNEVGMLSPLKIVTEMFDVTLSDA